MKNKKQFTLIELIIVIVVIGILAAMALPKFNGVVRDAKLSAMINDKEVLEKALVMYYQKNDELPLLNENQEFIIADKGISLSKIVLAEEAQDVDMDTIYKSLKETLTYYKDSEETLYRIDLSKIKDNLSKDIKYGHKKHDKDFYVYSTKTGNVYYYDYLVNGNGTIQHSEYDTLLKDNELVTKTISPSLSEDVSNNEDIVSIKKNTISLGAGHSLKIGNDGNIYSWGENLFGQLGIGNTINQIIPQKVELPNGEKPNYVFSGCYYSATITDKGNLYTWGNNSYGQLGIGNKTNQLTPQKVNLPNEEKVISVSLGENHSIIITDKGNLYSCGLNNSGQLGTENKIEHTTFQLIKLPNNEKPISVVAGGSHSMVTTDKGNLYTWGWNSYGQLGLGNKIEQSTPQKVNLPNGEKPISVVVGSNSSMMITDKENLYVWGRNDYGQLGLGSTVNQTTPQLLTMPNGEKPKYISTGYAHSTCITDKGNLYAWGFNGSGALGIGTKIDQLTPQLVSLPNNEKALANMNFYYSSITISNKGNIYVCGDNYYGQLGLGNKINQLFPTKVILP